MLHGLETFVMDLKLAQNGFQGRKLSDNLELLQSGKEGLQDAEGHSSQGPGLLVAMDPLVKVGLRKGAHAVDLVDVYQMAGFHSVTDGEGDLLQHGPADGVFPAQGLNYGTQFRQKEAEKRPHQYFRDPSASGGSDSLTEGSGRS